MKLVAKCRPGKDLRQPKRAQSTKTVLCMKLTSVFLLVAALQVSASSYGQTLTLSLKNVPLEKAIQEIERQSGFRFLYTEQQLKKTVPVTI